jgi:hypothetical protein
MSHRPFRLAIANASYRLDEASECEETDACTQQYSKFSANADFQHVSSHINPDITDIVGLSRRHVDVLEQTLQPNFFVLDHYDFAYQESAKDAGVPLLLPLTIGIEYEETTRSQEPKRRTLAVNVDPLSVMLSKEDIRLVRAIVDAWKLSRTQISPSDSPRQIFYDADFRFQRLGLGLRKENGFIIVDNVADPAQHRSILMGDRMHAINGERIVNAETITLAEMVNRLTIEPRPLVITFSRILDKEQQADDVQNRESQLPRLGVEDSIDMSLSSAVITLVEREVPLFRGSITTTKVGGHIKRSVGKSISMDISTAMSIEYYNLRIWGWEPFVEPGIVHFSSLWQEGAMGPRELSIEVSDRDGGLFVNFTDASVEALSKLMNWKENESDGDGMLPESEPVGDVGRPATTRRDLISRRAANEAFRFARKQKSGSAKPFLFRNKTGLSVAFVKQVRLSDGKKSSHIHSHLTVGEYIGLHQYEPSEIVEVGCEEEVKFYADVSTTVATSGGQADNSRFQQYPCLTVALQKTNGIVAAPFLDLQLSKLDEIVFPIKIKENFGSTTATGSPRDWMSWLVEHEDEKTVLTLGSSIRIVSFLNQPVELRFEQKSTSFEGMVRDASKLAQTVVLRTGKPFCLPVWLAMQQHSWRCSVRPIPDYCFSPIAIVSPDGTVEFETPTSSFCVECNSTVGGKRSAWLAISHQEEKGILTITIDCSISVRNLLPSSIDWEILETFAARDSLLDVTNHEVMKSSSPHPLKSGQYAEIFSNGWQMAAFRVRPAYVDHGWSSWTPISVLVSRSRKKDGIAESDEFRTTVSTQDVHGTPLPLGIRFTRKASGIDVSVYAELWCANTTPLDVIFGYPQYSFSMEEAKSNEISVAEATLKEISSLFDVGEWETANTAGNPLDIVRLSGQFSTYIPEERFEYVEIENMVERRRWWASANPFTIRKDVALASQSDDNSGGEAHWVSERWIASLTILLCNLLGLFFRKWMKRAKRFKDGRAVRVFASFRLFGSTIPTIAIEGGDGDVSVAGFEKEFS